MTKDNRTATFWIKHLDLQPHPEGGFFRETYRSPGTLSLGALHGFGGERNYSTAIYFLLRSGDKSNFHRIKSDELWHHHEGDSLTIYVLSATGLTEYRLGCDVEAGEQLQVVIPANHWFAARVEKGAYVLAGCTVAPGFDFHDFELATQRDLLHHFPDHDRIIGELTIA